MGELAVRLGGKTAGELIRAADWNALIDAIEVIEATLGDRLQVLSDTVGARLDGVDASIAGLLAGVDELQDRADALEAGVENLRERARRVTLRTEQSRFVIGELARITARITDLDGEPLSFGDASTRPWIDFVTVWGQLKPVAGFTSQGGAGDRTISVQVDADGIARVLLRAEHAEGFSDDAEAEVAAALTTTPSGAQQNLKEAILSASTPMEANVQGAFRVLSAEYGRSDAVSVRDYADAYYLKSPTLATGKFAPNFFHRWRDYRATVLAFAKADADPRTADPNLGSCSIQVTYRDWIGPWIHLDFFHDVGPLVADYRDVFRGLVRHDFAETLGRFQDQVQTVLVGKGVLGKQKHTAAIIRAVDQMDVVNPPPFLGNVSHLVRSGLTLQQATEFGQSAAIGVGDRPITFQAFTEATARADARTAEVAAMVTKYVDEELGRTQGELVLEVQRQQATFKDELLAESGTIQQVSREVRAVAGQVQGFQVALNAKADIQTLARLLPH
jgi:hypothetical protein